MGKELRRGRTVRSMMAFTGKAACMAQESLIGPMAQNMTARSMITTFMALAITDGQTTVNTRGSGGEIRCMEADGSLGVMVECMKEGTPMMRSMAMAFSNGLMDLCTMVNGRKTINMALVRT